ncbi:MAG: ATP-binding protein [Shimia sp.]
MLALASRWRRARRVQTGVTLGLVLLGPVLAVCTFLLLGPMAQVPGSGLLRSVLLLDFIYVLVVAALILQRVAQMIAARRARSAGSRLHLRLTGVFALVALLPAVLVAIFAMITVNFGLEGWFSERVREVIGASRTAAVAYQEAEREGLAEDATGIARVLDRARQRVGLTTDERFDAEAQDTLQTVRPQVERGLKESFLINSLGEIQVRGPQSYLFNYERPSDAQLDAARSQPVVLIEDYPQNEMRALVQLAASTDRYLYITREVDGAILALLDETEETAQLYQQLESDRGRLLLDFGLLYLGFALILVLASVWLGLWFAERLSRPVGRLTGAAQRIGAGDLDVRVPEEEGDDEIAMLGRYFNQMTGQLKGQRQTLLDNTRQIERRRRLFDSVLSSVTSGVIGLDAKGRTSFVNRAAEELLRLPPQEGQPLALAVPEFTALFERLRKSPTGRAQEEITLTRRGKREILFVRMATRLSENGKREGYVVAFEDVTDLVSAQRMAAWGDVARRIAHEIKNPLTPIQLSAERINRKFGAEVAEREKLDQMTEVIVRQTGDLRRIVDEFSKFARMPEPVRATQDIVEILRSAVLLQESGRPDIAWITDIPEPPLPADVDATMLNQALNNLLKNAAEAIDSRRETDPEALAQVTVRLTAADDMLTLMIEDTGVGLPEDRHRLFEPYVTQRAEGTGLGLPIVLKIIEEHDGTMTLTDGTPDATGHRGARAVITLPAASAGASEIQQKEAV